MSQRYGKKIRLTAWVTAAAVLLSLFTAAMVASGKSVSPTARMQLLSDGEVAREWADVSGAVAEWVPGKAAQAKVNQGLSISLSVPSAGDYRLALRYEMPKQAVETQTLSVAACGITTVCQLRFLWTDATGTYPTDRYGNELVAEQKLLPVPVTDFLRDNASLDGEGVVFHLSAGKQQISVTPQVLGLDVYALYVVPVESGGTMKQVNVSAGSAPLITIQGEYYRAKSDSYIRPDNEQDPSLTPYSSNKKYMNVLDGSSFDTAGQKVVWEFSVKKAGAYAITVRYNQQGNAALPVFRRVEIDGYVPSQAYASIAFPYLGNNRFVNLTVKDNSGKTALVWLEPGIHTISMTATGEPLESAYREVMGLVDQINDIGTSVRKMTGNDADANRTWDTEAYLPGIKTDLAQIQQKISDVYRQLDVVCGKKPSFANNLLYAVGKMQVLRKDLRTFPNKMSVFCEGSGSVGQILGDLLTALRSMPLSMDCIYLSDGAAVPDAGGNWLQSAGASLRTFAGSFSSHNNGAAYQVTAGKDSEALTVWVNRPIQYVEVMQQMIDARFTPKTGIKVNLSIMPNEQKLILANAAGKSPDMALGVAFYTPFDFAIRGACVNLLQYKDFLPWYNSEFNIESLLPMCFDNGVYGAAETQDFYVLIYRRDILKKLGLSVPDTWDDVRSMMPVLREYGMTFNTLLSNMSGIRNLTATSPFVYQSDGDFYSSSGTASAFTSSATAAGFKEMTDLFRIDGMQVYIPSFYNGLRYGTVPLGIGTFSTYLQMEVAAPELASKWGIALSPGTKVGNQIVRYQNADGTAGMVFKTNSSTEKKAYTLLKWWLSSDTQTDFAYTMQSSYGPEFQWNTANIKAFASLSYPPEDKAVILEQWKWQRENLRHPASYMVERDASNVFTGVAVDRENIRMALDRAQYESDQEITRRLQEFGFVDKNGKIIKDYPVNTISYLRSLLGER